MVQYGLVTLRRVEPDDHPAIQRWQNDPEVARWMTYDRRFSLEDIHLSEEKATKEGHPFIIEADGRAIGRIGLNKIRQRDQMASLYIFIGEKNVWGKGYGRDALMAILGFGFDVLNLRKIELWMLEGNERALHAYKAVGFVEDARVPDRTFLDGAYAANLILSVDRDVFVRIRADASA